jgi:hypothetical protein
MQIEDIPYLVTFPRTGSHYFNDLIYKELNINIEKSHSVTSIFDKNNNKKKTVITIVRDPKDSITSYVTLEKTQYSPNAITLPDKRIDQILTEYITIHDFLYKHADIVIDFNDLVSHPDSVIKKIISLLEIKEEDYKFFSKNKLEYAKEYCPSSKSLSGYKDTLLENFNIDLCYFYYNRILEKKIIV